MGKLNVLPGEVLSGVIQKLTEDVEIRYTNKQEDIYIYKRIVYLQFQEGVYKNSEGSKGKEKIVEDRMNNYCQTFITLCS